MKGKGKTAVFCPFIYHMILFFDTETTGFAPGKICQLSYVMQGKSGAAAKNFFFAVPYVEPGALAVHGFSPERLAVLSGGARFDDKIDEIEADFSSADLAVAHNIPFDLSFLQAEFAACSRSFSCNDTYCSMRGFTPVCGLKRSDGIRPKFPKLEELCSFLELYPYDVTRKTAELFSAYAGAHDARYDTAALYLEMNTARGRYREIEALFARCL